jgi:chloramphenicol O-acetyltransferase
MRTIYMQTWSRRQQFDLFSTYDSPYFGRCANVDLAAFYPGVKQRGHSLTIDSCT